MFSAWTIWVSFTRSTLLPDYSWAGWRNYTAMLATRNWQIAYANLFIYGICFVVLTMALGLLLAVLIDQRMRAREHLPRDLPLSAGGVLRGHRHGLGLAAQPQHRHPEAGARHRLDRVSVSIG